MLGVWGRGEEDGGRVGREENKREKIIRDDCVNRKFGGTYQRDGRQSRKVEGHTKRELVKASYTKVVAGDNRQQAAYGYGIYTKCAYRNMRM